MIKKRSDFNIMINAFQVKMEIMVLCCDIRAFNHLWKVRIIKEVCIRTKETGVKEPHVDPIRNIRLVLISFLKLVCSLITKG